ncbi:50S ribosomal protein L35 [PVC group bacterium (ex Bugula neritina AB1)]|nr:50S ribosomal protein L35 [PVC group bacterium (ex Bugula neritina AB1)]
MPKIRTKSGVAKRFKLTGSGLVMRSKSGKSHILTKKTTKRKRKMRGSVAVASLQESRSVKKMCPYL